MSQNPTQQLGGTSIELGEAVFAQCAYPALNHLLRQMSQLLPPHVSPSQRQQLWSGFCAAAIGYMAADLGKSTAHAVVQQLGQITESCFEPNQEKPH